MKIRLLVNGNLCLPLFLCLALAGCSLPKSEPRPPSVAEDNAIEAKNQKLIVGKWQKDGTDVIAEYFADGRYYVSSTTGDPDLSGKGSYSFLGANTIQIVGREGATGNFGVSFKGNTMEIKGLQSGNTNTYTRIAP